MTLRLPHVFAVQTHCVHCGCRPDDDDADAECPVLLREALNEAQAVIAEDDETARLFLDGSALSVARLTAARDARRPHVAAYKARQEGGR